MDESSKGEGKQVDKKVDKKKTDKKVDKKKADKQGKAFKKHGAFTKKDGRSNNFKGSRLSNTDPKRMTMDHHNAQKARMGRIVAVCAGSLLAILFTFRAFEQWERKNERVKRVEAITAKVKELEELVAESTGYTRYESALQAVVRLNSAMKILPERRSSFSRRMDAMIDEIKKGVPVAGDNYINPQTLVDLVHIPQGSFLMGRKPYELGKHDEVPQRKVTIPHHFWMGRTEITNFQLRRLFPNHKLDTWKRRRLDMDNQPAVKIDWNTADIFCRMMNEYAAKHKILPDGYEYRLPTEAEWEYACRAGTETRFYWGHEFQVVGASFANTLDKSSSKFLDWGSSRQAAPYDKYLVSAPVASFEPNAFGLYDMNGNVWEWCWDWYNPHAYKELPGLNPVQFTPVETELKRRKPFDSGYYYISSTAKVIRGGSWGNLPEDCRSSNRSFVEPNNKVSAGNADDDSGTSKGAKARRTTGANTGIGFRIVLAPKIITNK